MIKIANTGELTFLTAASGNNQPGLYVYNGSAWNNVNGVGDIDSKYPPVFLKEGTGIKFDWASSTRTLTVSSTTTASASIAGTTSNTFKINSSNTASSDSALVFERGNQGSDSQLYWNEAYDHFELMRGQWEAYLPLKCSKIKLGDENVGVTYSGSSLVLNVKSGGSVIIQVN